MKAKKEIFETNTADERGVRINKYLADAGVCSRREGDTAIEKGLVTIDGETAVMGSRVLPGQTVTYKGKDISKVEELVLIAFNKPVGIVCTTDRRDPDNIIDFISYPKRIFPIGRLDKDSEGLILLTNDGNIVNKILRAGNYHEKEYIVRVNKEINDEFISKMSAGVIIYDTVHNREVKTRPCTVEQIDKFTFRIVLTQGLNRQIRRMCEALDYRVRALTRVRIMNISLGRLKSGTYRNVTDYELARLKELISNSSNTPASGEMHGSEGETDSADLDASRDSLSRQARQRRTQYQARNGAGHSSAGAKAAGSDGRAAARSSAGHSAAGRSSAGTKAAGSDGRVSGHHSTYRAH